MPSLRGARVGSRWLHASALGTLMLFSAGAFAEESPMQFRTASTGGTDGYWWVVAEGRITSDTADKFSQFVSSELGSIWNSDGRVEVWLNSPGGDLYGGLTLG